ncbi:MAG TPA: DUF6665 family protein [Povalibacter sp.]|nr:DUF6665 family protein [Povalibacter sp.]
MSLSRFEGPLHANLTEEVAASLGESARRLRKALDLLARHDADVAAGSRPQSNAVRRDLLAEAAEKLWGYVVQRELVGLRDPEYIRDQYQVPDDVWRSMGPAAISRRRAAQLS